MPARGGKTLAPEPVPKPPHWPGDGCSTPGTPDPVPTRSQVLQGCDGQIGGVCGRYPPTEQPQPSQGPFPGCQEAPRQRSPTVPRGEGTAGTQHPCRDAGKATRVDNSRCHHVLGDKSFCRRAAPRGAFSTPNEAVELVCNACLRPARTHGCACRNQARRENQGSGGGWGTGSCGTPCHPPGKQSGVWGDAGVRRPWPLAALRPLHQSDAAVI